MSSTLQQLPRPVKIFLLRAVCLFAGWELLYLLLLQPTNIPDGQLTHFIVSCTTWFLSHFYPGTYAVGHTVFTPQNGRAVRVEDACNGLELMVLYCGFIIAMPTIKKNIWRKLAYMASGIIGITILNVLRCAALVWIVYYHKDFFTLSHKYIFNIIVYGAMIGTWIIYCKDRRYVL